MKKVPLLLLLVLNAYLLSGCVSLSLPLTSNINDLVLMGVKTNNKETLTFEYTSKVQDGIIKPYSKDKEKLWSDHPGFNHTESGTLKKMTTEFLASKFPGIIETNSYTEQVLKKLPSLKISLEEFYIEQYCADSNGKQVMVALFGGETNIILVAKIKVFVSITRGDKEISKLITATSEERYVAGVGTGTSTSNIYRGSESIENTHAKNIGNANNKILMLLNNYLEENGL